MSDDRPVNRRQFFKGTFAEIARFMLDLSAGTTAISAGKRNYLRPPGAVNEVLFNELCTRCDECIKVCPHQCIRGSHSETETGAKVGTPVIIPAEAACRLCADLPCITVCKDGALRPLEDIRKVKIGVAVIDSERCLDYRGDQDSLCRQCYSQCPLKDEAIYIEDSRPVVRANQCVGCGICENICQTIIYPATIRVFP